MYNTHSEFASIIGEVSELTTKTANLLKALSNMLESLANASLALSAVTVNTKSTQSTIDNLAFDNVLDTSFASSTDNAITNSKVSTNDESTQGSQKPNLNITLNSSHSSATSNTTVDLKPKSNNDFLQNCKTNNDAKNTLALATIAPESINFTLINSFPLNICGIATPLKVIATPTPKHTQSICSTQITTDTPLDNLGNQYPTINNQNLNLPAKMDVRILPSIIQDLLDKQSNAPNDVNQ